MKINSVTIHCMCVMMLLSGPLSACQPAAPSYTPVFTEQPCPMEIPYDYKVHCGTVSVREDRRQEKGNQVVLSVAIVEPPDGATGQTPVVVLTGGPGYGIVNSLASSLEPYRKIIAERTVVFFDQRGTGLSLPALDCPEVLEADQKLYLKDLPDDEETRIYMDAYATCKSRLEQSGITLSSYTTADSADDVRDLVTALGYPQVYLFGVSYGTKLGQVILLRHQSEGWISGAILDSVVPLQVDRGKEAWTNTQAIFKYMFTRCAADPKCNARYPDLQETFYATLDQLRRDPLEVRTFDPQTGEALNIKMNDYDFFRILFMMLYDAFQASSLPQMIDRVSQGDTKLLYFPYRQYLALDYALSEGMSLSVGCTEEASAINSEAVNQANATLDPAFQKLAQGHVENFQKLCRLWDVKPVNMQQLRPLKTELPVLILAGEQDPTTPLAWAELLHSSIPGSYFYAFPGTAHGVFTNQPDAHFCAESLVLQFLEDSAKPPDGSCLANIQPFPFQIPSQ